MSLSGTTISDLFCSYGPPIRHPMFPDRTHINGPMFPDWILIGTQYFQM